MNRDEKIIIFIISIFILIIIGMIYSGVSASLISFSAGGILTSFAWMILGVTFFGVMMMILGMCYFIHDIVGG